MNVIENIKNSWQLIVAYIFMSAIIIFLSLMGTAHAATVILKPAATITGESITLGHLFDGLERNENYVLGPAPRPGQDMVLNARTLLRVAAAMDLPWRPVSNADQVVLRRAATIIDEAMIKSRLQGRLEDQGMQGRFELQLAGVAEIILPYDQPQSFDIENFSFDPHSNHFQATLLAPSSDNPQRRLPVTGRVAHVIPVPVLKSALRNGDVIGPRDLAWIDLTEKDIKHDYILKENDLIGMTPRRMVLPGKPVQSIDIEAPELVSRGERVVIALQSGVLALSAEGRALQSGAKGDIIRITNTGSGRSIDAVVTGDGLVSIQ